ncbi:MAG: hypothetical protein WCA23_24110 [Stellaceae bacterium]
MTPKAARVCSPGYWGARRRAVPWTAAVFGEHQVAVGRTEEIAEARAHAETALSAYMGRARVV